MNSTASFVSQTTLVARRHGRRMFCWNAVLWGLGNGMVSTSLVIYIIKTLAEGTLNPGMIGLIIGWVIAAPRLIGILRILTPSLLDRLGSRKRLCFSGYLLSPLILLPLPILALRFEMFGTQYLYWALWLIGLIWALYHLVEYFASVALWGWLGDFLPAKIRVRFLARRERWMIAGQFSGMLVAGLYTWWLFPQATTTVQRLNLYLPPATLGILFLFLAAFPILSIPEPHWQAAPSFFSRLRHLLEPIHSRRFLPFLLFGIWIQFINGLTQGTQAIFLIRVLGLSMLTTLMLQSGTRCGQMVLTRSIANAIDRFGNYRVIALSLLITATGQLFYLFASPQFWFPACGAACVWVSWIGVNLGIQNLTIQLAPPDQRSSYIAFYYTVVTLAFGCATLCGGWIFDLFHTIEPIYFRFGFSCDFYDLSFVAGWFFRSLGVLFLLWGYCKTKERSS